MTKCRKHELSHYHQEAMQQANDYDLSVGQLDSTVAGTAVPQELTIGSYNMPLQYSS